jgi:hypothetical protein
MSYEKATIMSVMSRIRNDELVLPAIQRDFVWEPARMYSLLDSIFRGYPFSTLLFWNTKQRIQYRQFTSDWSPDHRFTFHIKEEGKKGSMVLDGQQRLQTIFMALYGNYGQKMLFFDLLSGVEPDDVSQAKYQFEYLSSQDAEKRNQDHAGKQLWVPLRDLANLNGKTIAPTAMKYLAQLKLDADSPGVGRLSQNISNAYSCLRGDEMLNYFTIDKDYGDDGLETDLEEILEIFVRVNSGGQVLSKSDLMFSLMQMMWEGAADAVTDLIEQLNPLGRYDFDKDFILKAALLCCDCGAKYEVKKLRNAETVKKLETNFERIANAMVNCMNFVVNRARLIDDRILRSNNTLLPFIYFFYQQPNQQVQGEDTHILMNRTLYLALMTSVFSRYADNYVDQVVNNSFKPYHKEKPGEFPIEAFNQFIYSKKGQNDFDDGLLQGNINYLMNIMEGGTRLPEGRRNCRPEVDHIFPQSKLRDNGFEEEQVNDYANLRLISQADNNWKRAQDPRPYFASNPASAAHHLIPTDCLEYDRYPEFLEKRRKLIRKRINDFFGIGSGLPGPPSTKKVKPFEEKLPQPEGDSSGTQADLQAYCTGLLSAEDTSHPILQQTESWKTAMPGNYGASWKSKYTNALARVGIYTVSDLARVIMTLKFEIIHIEDGYAYLRFSHQGPDGKRVKPSRFGKWGWHLVLRTLEQRGFEWREHVLNHDLLEQVRTSY